MNIQLNDVVDRAYDGEVAVSPGNLSLGAYACVGCIAAMDGETETFADFSLALSGLPVDGYHCLLTATAQLGEGFAAKVIEIDLSPFSDLDHVIDFRAQKREVVLSLRYVAMDVDFGAIAIAGSFAINGQTWSFDGYLPRVQPKR